MSDPVQPRRVTSDDGSEPLEDAEEAYCHPYDADDNPLRCRGPITQSECMTHAQSVSAAYYRWNTRPC